MIKLLKWLANKLGYFMLKKPDGEVASLTKEFCEQVEEKFPDTTGLYKREQVMRMLQNRFPSESKSTLAFSIELYVQSK